MQMEKQLPFQQYLDGLSLAFTYYSGIIKVCLSVKCINPDDAFVEYHFQSSHSRSTDGKYIVQQPFKIEDPHFGNTLYGAMVRLYAVEKRLQRNASLREQYTNFMREYESIDHMRQLSSDEINRQDGSVLHPPPSSTW